MNQMTDDEYDALFAEYERFMEERRRPFTEFRAAWDALLEEAFAPLLDALLRVIKWWRMRGQGK